MAIDLQTIAVLIPVFNEADQIASVVGSVPDFVDQFVIVNDRFDRRDGCRCQGAD